MKSLSVILLSSCFLLSACGESPKTGNKQSGFIKASFKMPDNTVKKPLKSQHISNKPLSVVFPGLGKRMPDKVMLSDPREMVSYVKGKVVKHDNEPLEEFLAKHGTITFRKGKDFFADWALNITVQNLKPNSTIVLKRASGMLNVREEGDKIPKTRFLEDAQGIVKTGKLTELGMPIQISFSTREKPFMKRPVKLGNYIVSGRAFATIGDIKVKDGKLDRQYDSLSTIIIVAKDYLKQARQGKLAKDKFSVRHVTYSSDKNKKGERVGVEGLVVLQKIPGKQLFRMRLLKQPRGWQVAEILKPWKLIYENRKNSKYSSDVMHIDVAKRVETFLKRKKLNNHIDSEIACSYSDTMGLCAVKIALLKNDEKTCTKKAYWYKKKGKQFRFVKEVSPELIMDYVNKKHILVKSKRKSKSLKDYVLDKATGLMLGKCSTF